MPEPAIPVAYAPAGGFAPTPRSQTTTIAMPQPYFTADQMNAHAIAAVEADRASQAVAVPDEVARLREALAEFVAALDEKRDANENMMQSVETAERSFAATDRIWANLELARAALAGAGAVEAKVQP